MPMISTQKRAEGMKHSKAIRALYNRIRAMALKMDNSSWKKKKSSQKQVPQGVAYKTESMVHSTSKVTNQQTSFKERVGEGGKEYKGCSV